MAKKPAKPTSSSVEKKPAEKKHSLDLFKEILPALYRGDKDFYDRCTDEERKGIQAFILIRWVSLVNDYQEIAPGMINDFVNVGFWQLYQHPSLQWKIMCIFAPMIANRPPRATWIKAPTKTKKSSTPLLDAYFLKKYPLINTDELSILKQKIDGVDDVKEIGKDYGMSDAEIKELVKEYKDSYGKAA